MRRAIAFTTMALLSAAAGAGETRAAGESMRFAITRNGELIGTYALEINRNGPETSVAAVTDLAVKAVFFTAYRLQHTENERWVNGRLMALSSKCDDNGTRHSVSAAAKGASLEVTVDGKSTLIDPNVMVENFWNPQLLGRSLMLSSKDGQITQVSVSDGGEEDLTINTQVVHAHRYTVNSRYSQDVWYDDQAHLVQMKFKVSDGSVITYQPL
jgi:Family of unknown function (DUF6134)